jgi:hypothetical protein
LGIFFQAALAGVWFAEILNTKVVDAFVVVGTRRIAGDGRFGWWWWGRIGWG